MAGSPNFVAAIWQPTASRKVRPIPMKICDVVTGPMAVGILGSTGARRRAWAQRATGRGPRVVMAGWLGLRTEPDGPLSGGGPRGGRR